MNTRLQVEHPVTEAVTGIDLVRAAAARRGGRAARVQAGGRPAGRPRDRGAPGGGGRCRGFLPSTGIVTAFEVPGAVRVDTGIEAGSPVPPFYDSLVAKVIAHGADRPEALARLRDALDRLRLEGVASNADLLAAVLAEPAFQAGALHTGFLEEHRIVQELGAMEPRAVAAAAAGRSLSAPRRRTSGPVVRRADEVDHVAVMTLATSDAARDGSGSRVRAPWAAGRPWRTGGVGEPTRWVAGGRTVEAVVDRAGDGARATVHIEGARFEVAVVTGGDAGWRLDVDGHDALVRPGTGDRVVDVVVISGRQHRLRLAAPPSPEALGPESDEPDALAAPMPGRIVRIHVAEGAHVVATDPLVVLEAMKMEHVIAATAPGRVVRLFVAVGDQVPRGAPLIELDAAPTGDVQGDD